MDAAFAKRQRSAYMKKLQSLGRSQRKEKEEVQVIILSLEKKIKK